GQEEKRSIFVKCHADAATCGCKPPLLRCRTGVFGRWSGSENLPSWNFQFVAPRPCPGGITLYTNDKDAAVVLAPHFAATEKVGKLDRITSDVCSGGKDRSSRIRSSTNVVIRSMIASAPCAAGRAPHIAARPAIQGDWP